MKLMGWILTALMCWFVIEACIGMILYAIDRYRR